MNITPLQSQTAADVPIEQLAHNRALTEQQKIGEVSRQFEALLLRQILQETQKTVIPSKYADNSTTAGIYHDMVTKQLADNISKSGTLGLAQSLQRQLTREFCPASTAGSDRPAGTTSHLPPETDQVRPTLCDEWRVASDGTNIQRPTAHPVTRHPSPVTSLPFQITAKLHP